MPNELMARRLRWASISVGAAFVLYALFIGYSQNRLLDRITGSKLDGVQVYFEERAQQEAAELRHRADAMSATIAKLSASHLENSQSFNITKEGIALTLEPFMDYSEIAAIEIVDKASQPYASMWRSEGKTVFRADYVMPPAFREKFNLSVRVPAVFEGTTQGYVTLFVNDQASLERKAKIKAGLTQAAQAELALLRGHFLGTAGPQGLVLLAGLAFVVFASRAIARSYGLIDAQRAELAAFNLTLEAKVRNRTQALEDAEAENRRINGELRTSEAELLTMVESLRRKDEDLRYQAFHDALTGLPNRALFLDRIDQSLATAARDGEIRGVIFFDLDHFKIVNDTLGHEAGDTLLKEVSQRIKQCLRKSDTVARLGGDEFVVLLGHAGSPEAYAIVAQKIIAAVSEPLGLCGNEVRVGCSLGIACFPADSDDAADLMKHADLAMYQAKSAGRGRYSFFQPEMTELSAQRLRDENALRHALSHGELELFYQPKISLQTQALCGVEALVRWRHPQRGLVPPGEFIPLAEATGLIVALGDWAMEQACRQIAAWRAMGLDEIKIAVNVSARQLQSADLVQRILALTQQYGVSPSSLELELTESVVMAKPELAARIFSALRETGLTIAIDDFGTGYSSLAYLRRLPIDVLKIDRSFVATVDSDAADGEIVKAILTLARSLHLSVVAEGVETAGQAGFLATHGCPVAQGYHFARPQPAEELTRWLRSRPGRSAPADTDNAQLNGAAGAVIA
jgi:diguanylate cyclase (GGDEF)-like protein